MLLKSLIRFSKHHSLRPLDPTAVRCLQSQERFHALVHRERARADRTQRPFALVSFRISSRYASRRNLLRMAKTALLRSRVTDDVGWFERHIVASLLPETTTQGAWVYAQGVADAVYAKLGFFPEVKVYSYPSNWVDRRDPEEYETAVVRRPRMHQDFPEGPVAAEPAGSAISMERLFLRPMSPAKRAMDLVGGWAILLMISPILLVAALAVKLSSPGPVIFRQKRAGIGGRPFIMYKFRSMYIDAEQRKAALMHLSQQDGPAFKMENDPRITFVGRWLRKTSIDELPQLWNVIKGDMSLVGPRPPTFDEVEKYETWFNRRLEITPGLTCIWQVYGRSRVAFHDWMRMDVRYAGRASLWQDVKLMANTIPAVVFGRGAK